MSPNKSAKVAQFKVNLYIMDSPKPTQVIFRRDRWCLGRPVRNEAFLHETAQFGRLAHDELEMLGLSLALPRLDDLLK